MRYKADAGEPLVAPVWRGKASLNLMLGKPELRSVLLRLFYHDPPMKASYERGQSTA